MRNALLATLMGSTVLWSGTTAIAQLQPQVTPQTAPVGEVRARAAIAECDRLIEFLEQPRLPDLGITIEQVRDWRHTANAEACRENLQRVNAIVGQPTQIAPGPTPQTGSPLGATESSPSPPPPVNAPPVNSPGVAPAPAPRAQPNAAVLPPPARGTEGTEEARPPQVLVQQAQPNVVVRQPRPEIIVRHAPPIITVEQPQPEIIVRMPEPDVNVSLVQPQVQVVMPRPEVQVVPPQPAPDQAGVEIERQQPIVRYERTGPPQIVYREAQGQPQIRFESGAGPAAANTPALSPALAQAAAAQPPSQPRLTPEAAQAQLNGGPGIAPAPRSALTAGQDVDVLQQPPRTVPQETGALPPAGAQRLSVDQLEDMAVYNARDEKLGDVERVVTGADNRFYAVVGYGGFLGLGERRVAMPLDQVALRDDRLIADALDEEQIRALPEFDDEAYRTLEGGQAAPVRILR